MRIAPLIALILLPTAPLLAADLPTRDTSVGRLALPIIPDSLVVSPDSSRLAFAAKSDDPTLEDKGVFLKPGTDNPANDSARAIVIPIRLFIDDKPTIPFDSMTTAAFSPDSKRLAFAGRTGKTWQLVLDAKTLTQDADDVPAAPIIFSPDSAHAAWVMQKNQHYLITADDHHWPPIDAGILGTMTYSPDSQHLAAVIQDHGTWTLYVDGMPLPQPPPLTTTIRPANAPSRGPSPTKPTPRLDRFSQFSWQPDSTGLAFIAAFTGTTWQVFTQSLNGTTTFASQPYDGILKNTPIFSPDSHQLAFAVSARNKWTVITRPPIAQPPPSSDDAPAPPAIPGPFDQLLADSICYYQPPNATTFTLLYFAQQNKKWRLYINNLPTGDAFDAIIQSSFLISPDKHHYAFAGTHDKRTWIIKDGTPLANYDEAGAATFAFSPDSQHLAYAARIETSWHPCLDGIPGAPFLIMTASPIAFSPDSSRIAYPAMTAQKTWRLIVGKDAQLQSKPYDGFVKGSHVTWRPDGTIVTMAIEKKVATRVEAKP